MRRLLVWVPRGTGDQVRETASRHDGTDAVSFSGEDGDGSSVDLVLLHVPNRRVGDLLYALSEVEGHRISMFPHEVLNLKPPSGEAPQQVKDVTLRSPLEVFLGGLQSVGSWAGFLGYAAASGLVAWVGLYTNTVYLLTAAMLIAPFAGPAMNAAVATARGDAGLLGRGLGRYLAGLALAIATAGLMSLLFDQRIATAQMTQTASISAAAVVLPLVAGAAGAINLSQSERSSLVSGAATGMLIAAALAPPAGLIGMSVVIEEWDMPKSGLFLLGLQLVGINLSGAAVFRLVGLNPAGSRYSRGRGWVQKVSLLATFLTLGGFLLWQFGDAPSLQRDTLAQRAEATAQEAVMKDGSVHPIQISAKFTEADIPNQNPLLVTAYVERTPSTKRSAVAMEQDLRQRIGRELRREISSATPLVDVTVLDTS